MRLIRAAVLLAATLTASTPDTRSGTWKVLFDAPREEAPKTVGSIILKLKVDGNSVTGTAVIGVWPGEATIADGKVDGNHIAFNATGRLGSTTGIPTCHFQVEVEGDEMNVRMTAIKNAGGPLGSDVVYSYKGKRTAE